VFKIQICLFVKFFKMYSLNDDKMYLVLVTNTDQAGHVFTIVRSTQEKNLAQFI
jgi:hypothetical protein